MAPIIAPTRPLNESPPPASSERGVALLLAIIVLTVMSVLVTAGFYAVRQESRMGAASGRIVEAKYLAEDAAIGVLANWQGDVFGVLPNGATARVSDSTAAGATLVDVTRTGAGLFFLTSEARIGLDGTGGAASSRRVGLMARLRQTQFYSPSALVASGNVEVSGTARVEGADYTPTAWGAVCAGPSLTRGGITHLGAAVVSVTDPAVVHGAPALNINDPTASNATTVFSELTWAELVALADKTITGGNIGSIAPVSATGACDTAALFNWGNPSNPTAPCGAYFPIIHITGDARMTGGGLGQGILLVDGDLDILQPFGFFGIVIVRGKFDTETNVAQIYGHLRAHDVRLTSVSPTTPSLVGLSNCAIERAVVNHPMLTRAVPIGERSWVDLTSLEG